MTTGRLDAGRRLRRLLAVLAYLAEHQSATLDQLAVRFEVPEVELIGDLQLAACCGLPPYTPDQLMEILVDETKVEARLGAELARPRRLTRDEGFALLAAARAIAAVPGADPQGALSRALDKLDTVLGMSGSVVVQLDTPPLLDDIRHACEAAQQIEIEYHSSSRDEVTARVVDPGGIFESEGHWYLDAYCHRSGGVRRFRVDRLRWMKPTGSATCHHVTSDNLVGTTGGARSGGDSDVTRGDALIGDTVRGPAAGMTFVPGPEAAVVRMAIDEGGRWLLEAVPVLGVADLDDGRKEVTIAVAGRAWFDRLLLRLGTHARVLGPPELLDAATQAAQRVIEAYAVADTS